MIAAAARSLAAALEEAPENRSCLFVGKCASDLKLHFGGGHTISRDFIRSQSAEPKLQTGPVDSCALQSVYCIVLSWRYFAESCFARRSTLCGNDLFPTSEAKDSIRGVISCATTAHIWSRICGQKKPSIITNMRDCFLCAMGLSLYSAFSLLHVKRWFALTLRIEAFQFIELINLTENSNFLHQS